MATITVNSDALINIASKIEGNVNDLDADVTKINSLCEEVKANWTGADSNSYYNAAKEKATAIKQTVDVLREMPADLNKIAAMMKEAEQTTPGGN